MDDGSGALAREIEYHERLYSGFAQQHFARAAVRALRTHMVGRIVGVTGVPATARVLSIGCGIGDTELLLAPRVLELVGIDASPSAIRQARADAAKAGRSDLRYIEGTLEAQELKPASFDLIMAIFFLHHLPGEVLQMMPGRVIELLKPGGCFYSLDPSRYRLSGAIGSLMFPKLMRKYQLPGVRQLRSGETASLFTRAGFECRLEYYDFVSSPLAGLFPGWAKGYRAARRVDNLIVRVPGLKRMGSNFEIIARKPVRPS
jgi:SAM-dependent methyltransferase